MTALAEAPRRGADGTRSARDRAAACLGIDPGIIEADLMAFMTAVEGDVMLNARAGSGKTAALTAKVAHLVLDHGLPPNSIMMLAFNAAAAEEMRARLVRYGVPEGVQVRTFHALAGAVLRAHDGGRRTVTYEDDSAAARVLAKLRDEATREVADTRFRQSCGSLLEVRASHRDAMLSGALVSAANFLRMRGYGRQRRVDDEVGPGAIVPYAYKLAVLLEEKMRQEQLLDGPGVLQAAAWCLEREIEGRAKRTPLGRNLRVVFVDEAQDLAAPYVALLRLLREANPGMRLEAVGDAAQAINGFAGADARFIAAPGSFMTAPQKLDLLCNRRCAASIVREGNGVINMAGIDLAPARADPARGEGMVSDRTTPTAADLIPAALAKIVAPGTTSVAMIARRRIVGHRRSGARIKLTELRTRVAAELTRMGNQAEVTALTAHAAKGLEWDQVLILDDGCFPLRHASRDLLLPLISDRAYAREEACLEYVAVTRARDRLDRVRL